MARQSPFPTLVAEVRSMPTPPNGPFTASEPPTSAPADDSVASIRNELERRLSTSDSDKEEIAARLEGSFILKAVNPHPDVENIAKTISLPKEHGPSEQAFEALRTPTEV